MVTTRRTARRLAGRRRRRAVSCRISGSPATGRHERSRPARLPLVLHVALPADTLPDTHRVFDEAADRIAGLAQVQFTTAACLPDDVPFFVRLPGSRPPSARRERAVVAFMDALTDVMAELGDQA